MFVSLHLSPPSRSESEDIACVDELIEMAILSDRAGVASICLTEHHLAGFNTYCDPLALGMHLAAHLEQAYIGVHVVQAPLHHPVRMAEQCNLLDLLTRGRCMIAFAPGSTRSIELDAFGVGVEARSDMTRQRVDAILRAWSWEDGSDPVDVSTDYDQGLVAGRLSPSSYRKPHPLIGRATLTPATVAETARAGMPVILLRPDRQPVEHYREILHSSGHSDEVVSECEDWLGFIAVVSLAPTEEKAKRRLRDLVEGGGSTPLVSVAEMSNQLWVEEWKMRQAGRSETYLPLTPEAMVETLLGIAEEYGVNHLRYVPANVPGQREENMEAMHLFLEEVLPHLGPERLRDPAQTVATQHDPVLGRSS